MFSFLKYAYLFFILVTTAYSMVLTTGCNQGTEYQDVQNAIDDVQAVAKAALAAITSGKINGKDDVFHGAYDPLFLPEDRIRLALIFAKLSTIRTQAPGSLFVMIYCTENHIRLRKNDPSTYWEDVDYVSRPNGRTMALPVGRASGPKPGAKGSYTSLGYKESDDWDTSHLAHIYLADERRHPPANTNRDLRRYPDIVKDGLDDKYTFIENIKPLAQTVMHELLHAVGGLTDPDPSQDKKRHMVINDGPNKQTYGWLNCNWRRDFGTSNQNIADCITFLAQAIYLQIQGKDTYWTTGEVDPNTLLPKYLSN